MYDLVIPDAILNYVNALMIGGAGDRFATMSISIVSIRVEARIKAAKRAERQVVQYALWSLALAVWGRSGCKGYISPS